MRYANFCNTGKTSINLGDYLQFLAIANLYDKMGIPESEIYHLGLWDVADYEGEELVLPINFSINSFIRDGKIAISPRITPVFLAIQLLSVDSYTDYDLFFQDHQNRSYFLQHAPIGCRDEATYRYFKKYDIPAYINGCLTATFSKCNSTKGKSIIFADAPWALLPWVPKELLASKQVLFATQQFAFTAEEIKNYQSIFEFVKNHYAFYRENAGLIVTARLHVALPCTAFGIPVILAKDKVDARFSFIEHYLPIYDETQYQAINWSPNVPDIESTKEHLIHLAIQRIQNAAALVTDGVALTTMFDQRKRLESYTEPHKTTHNQGVIFETYAEKNWKDKPTIRYALWGANANNAAFWKELIDANYPNAELSAVFDRYKRGELFGLPLQSPEALSDMDDIHVIVCAVGAVSDALALFRQFGIQEERYCIATDRFISSEDLENLRQ